MMKKLLMPILGVLGFSSLMANSYQIEGDPNKNADTDTVKKVKPIDLGDITLTDDPFVAKLDSLLYLNLFIENGNEQDSQDFIDIDKDSAISAPHFSDETYKKRLHTLNNLTPFKLDYNADVRKYIDVYSLKRREQVSRMLGLAEYYFPLFEETLDKYELPLELKYLAIVESALNPMARSRVGATGLWQFMFSTGRLNGLSVNSYVDDRNDPIKSTEAACKYLSYLYGIFDDWNLALAAYNSGPGNVNKAIRRSGGKRTYWEIRPYLPRETRGYVPAFIAVNYIMNHAADHYIYATEVKPSYFTTDTVAIKAQLSFEQIQKLVDISEEELMFLNPAFRLKIIPKNTKKPYTLVLPSNKMGLFIANEDSIYALAAKDFEQQKAAAPVLVELNDKIRHKVQRGEVLGTIAEKYGVSVSSLKRWNGLRGNTIRIGQNLTVYPRRMPSTTTTASDSKPTATPSADGKYLTHTVRNGETFYSIAKSYPGISAQNIMDWNSIANARSLKPGMRIKIYAN